MGFFDARTTAIITSVPIFGMIAAVTLGATQIVREIQWAWIAPRFWKPFFVVCIVLMAVIVSSLGGAISRVFRAREGELLISFLILSSVGYEYILHRLAAGEIPAWGLEPPLSSRGLVVGWWLAAASYVFGCFRVRQRRIRRISKWADLEDAEKPLEQA